MNHHDEVQRLELELYRAAADDPGVKAAINAWADKKDEPFDLYRTAAQDPGVKAAINAWADPDLAAEPTTHDLIVALRERLGLFAGAMTCSPKAAWEEALAAVKHAATKCGRCGRHEVPGAKPCAIGDPACPITAAWVLTGPDGRQWGGERPIRACAAATRDTVDPALAMQRIMAVLDEPPPADDAFVAIGCERFSDGAHQTAESLGLAVEAWRSAGGSIE